MLWLGPAIRTSRRRPQATGAAAQEQVEVKMRHGESFEQTEGAHREERQQSECHGGSRVAASSH